MCIFWATVAIRRWVAVGEYAMNAFAQAAPPKEPKYVRIDDQMTEWMEETQGHIPARTKVITVLCALQGHPAAGSLWADKVKEILVDGLHFICATHETCLYIRSFADQDVLIGCQVDDFMAAGQEEKGLRALFAHLATKIKIEAEVALLTHYNGIEIIQDRDYVKIPVSTYIGKILANHGWERGSKSESRLIKRYTQVLLGNWKNPPPTDAIEMSKLEAAAVFIYRTVIGELLYIFVTCRLDMGYAMQELSKFSCGPYTCHYAAMKRVYWYLH
jgi:hypothetical protein